MLGIKSFLSTTDTDKGIFIIIVKLLFGYLCAELEIDCICMCMYVKRCNMKSDMAEM